MIGLAANDAAERHEPVIALARALAGFGGKHDGRRNFKRTGHGNLLELRGRGFECAGDAVEKATDNMIVEPCFHDQDIAAHEPLPAFFAGWRMACVPKM